MKILIQTILLTLTICFFASFTTAQSNSSVLPNGCPVEMPAGTVCITRERAIKAASDSDAIAAYEASAKQTAQAIADLKDALSKMTIEYSKAAAENSILKQDKVDDRADKDLLLSRTKRKCLPFSICIGN